MSAHVIVERDRCDILGEGPLWSSRHQALLWVDVLSRRVNRLRLADGHVETWDMPDTVGWVIEHDGPGIIAGVGRTIREIDLEAGMTRILASVEPEREANRFNDAKADAHGRVWAGTMSMQADRPSGALYRFDPDGTVNRVDDGYLITNGPAIAPGGEFMLHTDTGRNAIYRFAIRDDGSLGPRETHLAFDPAWGHPDGMTFDAEGHLWVACWGTGMILRLDRDGVPERQISLPTPNVTSCTFAGDDLDRMFVTTASLRATDPLAGALFEVDPGCRGLPTCRYGGSGL